MLYVCLGRFEACFLEERRAALCLFLTRIRDHNTLSRSPHFHSFLYETEDQLLLEKNAFFAEQENVLRTSLSGWFGSALHSLATNVGKYEEVGLGFNPLDVQVDEIEKYVEPLSEAMTRLDQCTRQLVAARYKSQEVLSEWGRWVLICVCFCSLTILLFFDVGYDHYSYPIHTALRNTYNLFICSIRRDTTHHPINQSIASLTAYLVQGGMFVG